jgi:hypothetical protein
MDRYSKPLDIFLESQIRDVTNVSKIGIHALVRRSAGKMFFFSRYLESLETRTPKESFLLTQTETI